MIFLSKKIDSKECKSDGESLSKFREVAKFRHKLFFVRPSRITSNNNHLYGRG